MREYGWCMPPTAKKGSVRAGLLRCFFALLLVSCATPSQAASPVCKKVVLKGEVKAGRAWSAPFGNGWIFRVLPIQPHDKYSGWDLIVDRAQPAGFPDALFLATPPYGSINEREIGTTYGLRSQDAIGWNPRTFNFLLKPEDFREAQALFLDLKKRGALYRTMPANQQDATDTTHLMNLSQRASVGEFHIDDARLVPGAADPKPYAREWAQAASRTPHEVEPSGPASGTPLGSLDWMRFTVTLWLPDDWKLPQGVNSKTVSCP